jgi:hypothetical protein
LLLRSSKKLTGASQLSHKIISWPAAALKLAVQQGFPDQQLKQDSTVAGQQNSS